MRRRMWLLAALPALLVAASLWLGSQAPSCVPVEPVDPAECTDEECGPPPLCPVYECPDGSMAGCTGPCVRNEDGQCGWVVRDCPDPCADIPQCEFLCPPGTHNPTDEHGCVHTCECVPDAECTPEECGPAPDCPVYECPDGSLGGCTDRCFRHEDGQCGWEVRECPPTGQLQWYQTCGDPVCGGWRASDLPLCTTQVEGAACAHEGAMCDLHNDCNTRLLCTDQDPRLNGCPISRQAFKQEIRYLGAAERDRVRDELLGFRLATYRYRGAPERLHLGFIIEDQEPSAAIDGQRDMVDLYGYTSMVVAALQSQSEELAALRKQVADLQARLAEPRK